MKNIKRSVSIFLALLMIFSSFSMLATTASAAAEYNWSIDTVFYRQARDVTGNIIEGSWVETENAMKGEKLKARVFMTTDFPFATSQFFFFYPLDFLTHDLSQYETTANGYEIAGNPNCVNAGGEVTVGTSVGTSGKAYQMVQRHFITAADVEGNGWIFVNMFSGDSTEILDGSDWLMEFNFTVNENATKEDMGQLYLQPNCIADYEDWRKATIIGVGWEEGGDFVDDCDQTIDIDTELVSYTLNDKDDVDTAGVLDSRVDLVSSLTFDTADGAFEDGTTEFVVPDYEVQATTPIANFPGAPIYEDYTFIGWVDKAKYDAGTYTEEDIINDEYVLNGNYNYQHDEVTLVALYEAPNFVTVNVHYTDAVTGEEVVNSTKTYGTNTGNYVQIINDINIPDEVPETITYIPFSKLPTIEHYKFDDVNASNKLIVSSAEADGKSELDVYYVPVDYTATFDPANGEAVTTATQAYWSEVTAPAAPEKSGYKFTNWLAEDGSTLAAGEKFNLAGDVKYTAQYESAETTVAIKVKYNDLANGGAEKIVTHDTVETIAGYTVALAAADEGAENTTYYLIEDLPEIAHYEYDAANTTTTVTANSDGTAELIVAYKPVKYTATFTGAESFTDVDYFTEITAPEGPGSAGQKFTGWKLDGSETVISAGDKFNIDANVTYTAVYEDIYYNTTLSFNGEADVDYPAKAVLPTVASGKMGKEIVLNNPDPVTGWTFLGWETPVGAVEKDGKYYYGTTDVTVAGNWEHNEYTVTYWLDTAKTVYYDMQTYFYGDPVEILDAPPADLMPAGKEFVEWDTDIVSMPAENIDIVASSNDIIYTVSITTIPGEAPITFDAKYGDEITAEDLAAYENYEGYTFGGWTINGKPANLPYKVVGNTGIKGTFTLNTWDLYFWADTEDYDAFVAGDTTVQPIKKVEGVEFEAPIDSLTPVDPSRTGYTFTGWDIEPTLMEDNDMHICAWWDIESYTVFWDNDGSVVEHSYEYGEDLVIPEVSKTGYTFKGWSGLAEGTTTMPDIGESGDEITYTAAWEANSYDAIFYLDEEMTQVYATVPTLFNENIVAPAAPSKDGYDFGGWTPAVGKMDDINGKKFVATWTAKGDTPYTVSIYTMDTTGNYGAAEVLNFTAATDSPVSYAPEAKTGFTITEDSVLNGTVSADGKTNLVVKYSRNQYTFKTVVDGAETSSTTYYYDAAVAAPATPVKTGYTFSGWDAAVPAKMPANDVTLSGTFAAAQFDLIYKVDGEVYTSEKVTFGTSVTVIDALTKEGYTFSGWDKTGTFTMPAETVTISGTFSIDSYKVIYKVDGNVVHEATAEYNSKVDLYDYTPAEGYTFSGWDKEDGFTMPASEVIVNGTTSKITVTVTYKFVGDVPADYPVPVSVTATYGESVKKYELYEGNDLVTGYISTLVSIEGAVDDRTAEYPYVVGTENITITYSWSRVRVYVKTTYTGDVPAGYETTEDWSKRYNDTFTLTTPAEEGYTFNGWTVEGAAEYDAATGTVKAGTADITITGAWEINKYDVIYMVDGVEYSRVEDVAYGTPVTVLGDLVEAGKEFSGWTINGAPAEDFTMPDNDVTIVGSWTANSYTVTYYNDKDKSDVTYTYTGILGAEYNVPVDPSKEGHKFLGWANVADDAAAGLPEAGAIAIVPLDGAEYYATWETLSYKLVYAAGTDATFSDGTTQKTYDVAYGTAQADWDVPAETLTRPGYTFGGWDMSNAPATMGAAPVRINAIWNPVDYTVTWINGENEVVEHYIYGEEIIAPDAGEREGWSFDGWLEADGVTYFSDGDIMGEKSLVYTAQWLGNEGVEYTVCRYFENVDKTDWMNGAEAEELTGKAASTVLTGKAGTDAEVDTAAEAVDGFTIDESISVLKKEIAGDGSTVLEIYYKRDTVSVTVKDPDGETYIDDEFTYGEEITLEDPDKEGFTFVEWQDGEGNKVTFPMAAPADDVVIKPVWTTNTYTITFENDNGDVIEAAKTVEYGSTIVAPADPEKDGFKFAYWVDKDTGIIMPATMPAKDATYVAYYTAGENTTYYIEIYMMDTNGEYTSASRTELHGTTGAPISVTPGVITGCTHDAGKSVLTGVITADGQATLKVYYARDIYNVTFNAGDGVFENNATVVGPTDVYFGAAIPVPAEPTRDGYEFAGWDAEVPATMPAENLSFTATWTEAEYTITYVVNDKKTVETYKYGEKVDAPADPVVAGMTFKNWDTEIPATMPAEDLIIIAVFEISVYEVKYLVDGVVFQQYSVAHGDTIPVPAEEPTKKFHTFSGWTEIPATMPAESIEINAIFERVPVRLIPKAGSTTVIDDDVMAIYGLELYATEEILREKYLDIEGDGYFTVTPSKKTACGTGTVIEVYDNVTGEKIDEQTYTIVIFGDLNGDSKINNNDYSIAKAEVDMFTFWSDPMDNSYNVYKTMAADFDRDGMISVKEASSINRYVLGSRDFNQVTGEVIELY